jgi:hypothetical protein
LEENWQKHVSQMIILLGVFLHDDQEMVFYNRMKECNGNALSILGQMRVIGQIKNGNESYGVEIMLKMELQY